MCTYLPKFGPPCGAAATCRAATRCRAHYEAKGWTPCPTCGGKNRRMSAESCAVCTPAIRTGMLHGMSYTAAREDVAKAAGALEGLRAYEQNKAAAEAGAAGAAQNAVKKRLDEIQLAVAEVATLLGVDLDT